MRSLNRDRSKITDRRPQFVAIAAATVSLAVVFGFLSLYGDATGFLRLPEANPEFVAYVEGLIGPSLVAPDLGHDGKFFFIQANDPLLIEPEEGFGFFDWPAYRAQRMLYPLLAGVFGLLAPGQIVWSLIVVNVLAMVLGTWALARVALGLGASPWLGLAFVLNPGMIFDLSINGSSVLGWALAVWALAALQDGRWTSGALLLSGSVLSRESMGLVAIGAFVYVWRRHVLVRWRVLAVPAAAGGLWWLWARIRVGDLPASPVAGNLDIPFRGLIEGVRNWLDSGGLNLALGALVVFCTLLVVWSALANPSLLTWSTVGFVPLMSVLHSDVVRGALNMTRAVAPILTVGVMLAVSRRALRSGRAEVPRLARYA